MSAFRNLLHDRVPFGITLAGIVFSVVLSAVQLGRFLGFTRATVDVIGQSKADLWVASKGVTRLEFGVPFSESLRHLALGVQGVADAQAHIVSFSTWTRPDGARDDATGRVWIAPHAPAFTRQAMVDEACSQLGIAPRIQVISPPMMRLARFFVPAAREGVEMLYQFTEPFVVSSAAIEAASGLTPTSQMVRNTPTQGRTAAST